MSHVSPQCVSVVSYFVYVCYQYVICVGCKLSESCGDVTPQIKFFLIIVVSETVIVVQVTVIVVSETVIVVQETVIIV